MTVSRLRTLLALAVMLPLLAACVSSAHYVSPGRQLSSPPTDGGYPYWLHVPDTYPQLARRGGAPLMIFLHGSGERGSDLAKVKTHGPPKLAASDPSYPFLTLSPLLEAEGDWDIARLETTLQPILRRYRIDRDRIYLTGLSRGAHAVWRWAAADPRRFAAIAPVSGRGDPKAACALARLPVWAFHGAEDTVVPVSGTTDMIEAIAACGGTARQTIYPQTGHDAWTRSYSDSEFNRWLLAQHRTRRIDPIRQTRVTRGNPR